MFIGTKLHAAQATRHGAVGLVRAEWKVTAPGDRAPCLFQAVAAAPSLNTPSSVPRLGGAQSRPLEERVQISGHLQTLLPGPAGAVGTGLAARTQDEVDRSLRAVKTQHRGDPHVSLRDGPPAAPVWSPIWGADGCFTGAGRVKQGGPWLISPRPRAALSWRPGTSRANLFTGLLPCALGSSPLLPPPKVCDVF